MKTIAGILFITYVFYIVIFSLKRWAERTGSKLKYLALILGWLLFIPGIILDIIAGAIMSVLLLTTVTRQMKLILECDKPQSIRYRIAEFICARLLDPFNKDHCE